MTPSVTFSNNTGVSTWVYEQLSMAADMSEEDIIVLPPAGSKGAVALFMVGWEELEKLSDEAIAEVFIYSIYCTISQ